MESNRRTRRWFQCLTILKPETPENKFAFKAGWKAHERIQKDFPNARAEKPEFHDDPTLDFTICYHADLYDPEKQIVYEIKSEKWFRENEYYCRCQLSGYCFFKQARGIFLIYNADGYAGLRRELVPWEVLREIAIKSDNLLIEKGL